MNVFAYIFWDSDPDIFQIPNTEFRITWYGVLFALSFWIGCHIFVHLFSRFLCRYTAFHKKDMNESAYNTNPLFRHKDYKNPQALYEQVQSGITKDISLNKKQKKLLEYSEKRYGSSHTTSLKFRFYLENAFPKIFISLKQRARDFADSLMIYVLLATVIGARLCHVFFYEDFWAYLQSPLSILKTWEGGLASHGGIIAILLVLALFRFINYKRYPEFTLYNIFDCIGIPTMLVAGMIRLGNFFNQEILGTVSQKPWAIAFGHPADGVAFIPRHPAQIYEMFIYWSIFAALVILWKKRDFTIPAGMYAGIAISGSFISRFFIEYCKVEQSYWFLDGEKKLLMGQILSIPCILVGMLLIFRQPLEKFFVNKVSAVFSIKRRER